jgi:hypothetical protein
MKGSQATLSGAGPVPAAPLAAEPPVAAFVKTRLAAAIPRQRLPETALRKVSIAPDPSESNRIQPPPTPGRRPPGPPWPRPLSIAACPSALALIRAPPPPPTPSRQIAPAPSQSNRLPASPSWPCRASPALALRARSPIERLEPQSCLHSGTREVGDRCRAGCEQGSPEHGNSSY